MIAATLLKEPRAIPLVAALVGLVIGLLVGLLPEKSTVRNVRDDWTPLAELKSSDVQPAIAQLLASPQWEKVVVTEDPEENLLQVPGRPGVLAYLSVVAIVKEPQVTALLRVGRLPASLQEDLLMSPDANGVITVRSGDTVSAGWSIDDISETTVTLSQVADEQEQGEERNVVQYNLYEWIK